MKILELQEEFAAKDLVDGHLILSQMLLAKDPYALLLHGNMVDSSFCNLSLLSQTRDFFTTAHVVSLVAIATNKRGNEHAVHVCKESSMLKHRLYKSSNTESLRDTLLAWSFRQNFMFSSGAINL